VGCKQDLSNSAPWKVEDAVSEKRLHWNSLSTPSMARMRSCYEAAGDKVGAVVKKRGIGIRQFLSYSVESRAFLVLGSFRSRRKLTSMVEQQSIQASNEVESHWSIFIAPRAGYANLTLLQ
jgi:hypothetical protein